VSQFQFAHVNVYYSLVLHFRASTRYVCSTVHMTIFVQYNVVCVLVHPQIPAVCEGSNVRLKLLTAERGDSTLLLPPVLPV